MSLTKVSYSMITGAVVNVLDYGAVGDYDGSSGTDNTAAFQAAVNACPEGGVVYIPVGYYKTTASVFSTKSIRIVGEGFTNSNQAPFGDASWNTISNYHGSVIIAKQSAGTVFSFGDAAVNKIFQFKDFMIVGPGSGTQTGLEFVRSVGSNIDNILVCNCARGMATLNVQDGSFNKYAAKGCSIGAQMGGTITSNQNVFTNPEFQSYDQFGLYLVAASDIVVIGGLFQDARGTAVGLRVTSDSSKSLLLGTWFESSFATTYAIYTDGYQTQANSCYFSTPGDRVYFAANADQSRMINCYFDPTMTDAIYIAAGAASVRILDSQPTGTGYIQDLGTNTIIVDDSALGFVNQIAGSRAVKNYDVVGGLPGNAATIAKQVVRKASMGDGTYTIFARVYAPNITNSAAVKLTVVGTLGDGTANQTVTYYIGLLRIQNSSVVAQLSSAIGATNITTAGNTATVAIDITSIGGGATALQDFAIRASVTKSGGASDNHYAVMEIELINYDDGGMYLG